MAPKEVGKAPAKRTGFIKGVRSEWNKIVWPTKQELIKYAVVVTVISALVAVFVHGLDTLFHFLLSLII